MELKAQLDESGLVLEGEALVDATLERVPRVPVPNIALTSTDGDCLG